LSCQVGIVVES
jgi:hypothetical protein